jgi:hypothetical protein
VREPGGGGVACASVREYTLSGKCKRVVSRYADRVRDYRTEVGNRDRLVAVIFSLSVVGTLIFDAAHAWFWQRAYDTAPVAALLVLALVAALLRRLRFAWWIFLIVGVAGLPSWVVHGVSEGVSAGFVLGLVLVQVALLLSLPMRRYVGVGRWHSRQPLEVSGA